MVPIPLCYSDLPTVSELNLNQFVNFDPKSSDFLSNLFSFEITSLPFKFPYCCQFLGIRLSSHSPLFFNILCAASAVKSAHIFEEMAECMQRMDDALYSTILHSSSDGEKSETETETGTLHTAIQTISKTDVTHGGINSIDFEKRNAVDDVMVRARNTFTYDSRSKDASGVAVEV